MGSELHLDEVLRLQQTITVHTLPTLRDPDGERRAVCDVAPNITLTSLEILSGRLFAPATVGDTTCLRYPALPHWSIDVTKTVDNFQHSCRVIHWLEALSLTVPETTLLCVA